MKDKVDGWRASSLAYSLAVLVLSATALAFYLSLDGPSSSVTQAAVSKDDLAPSATFPGVGVGPIPDLASGCQPNQGTPLNVTFNVTGIPGAPSVVDASVTFGGPNHTWAGDVTTTLIAPNGTSKVLFGRVLATTSTAAGDSSDLGGTYTFADANTSPPSGGFWQAATAEATGTAPIANGAYRSTDSGGAGATNPMPATSLNSAFAGIPTSNGTWTLRFTDGCNLDTGAVSAASLTLTGAAPAPVQHVIDYNGDGKTDFSVVRNTGGGAMGQVTWFNGLNMPGGTTQAFEWGIATDFFVPGDYDGDQKTDIAVWRPLSNGAPSGNAFWYILQSNGFTVRIEDFGQTGDDPTVIGDYNGDGKTDVAVYRAGLVSGDPSTWFYRTTAGGPVAYIGWGQSGDFPCPGDYDGDGKADFCTQRNNGGGSAAFWRRTALGVNSVTVFGTPTDVIVPGDYDGDGKTDLAVIRGSGGNIRWYWLPSSTGVMQQILWGSSATDFPVQGDYDGDGRTDPATWRTSATPGASAFWYYGSTSGPVSVPFGANGDYPVANYNSH